MDPLSITGAVLAVVQLATSALQSYQTAANQFTTAELSIASLRTECSIIRHILVQIQTLMCKDKPQKVEDKFGKPLLSDYRDVLGACSSTFALLNEHLEKLGFDELGRAGTISLTNRLRYLSAQPQIDIIAQHISRQAAALNLLLSAFQSEITTKTFDILASQDAKCILASVSSDARSLRESYSEGSHVKDMPPGSLLGDEEFQFDNEVINSRAYRRVYEAWSSLTTTANQAATTEAKESPKSEIEDIPDGPQVLIPRAQQPDLGTASNPSLDLDDIINNIYPLADEYSGHLGGDAEPPAKDLNAQRRAFEELPGGWSPTEVVNILSYSELASLKELGLRQASRFKVLRESDVHDLAKELRNLDSRTDYLRRTYHSLARGRHNLTSRIVQYLGSPSVGMLSKESLLKQEEALCELDKSIDEWRIKLERAENRTVRVRQHLLEHIAASCILDRYQEHKSTPGEDIQVIIDWDEPGRQHGDVSGMVPTPWIWASISAMAISGQQQDPPTIAPEIPVTLPPNYRGGDSVSSAQLVYKSPVGPHQIAHENHQSFNSSISPLHFIQQEKPSIEVG